MKKQFFLITAIILCFHASAQEGTINLTGEAKKLVSPDKAVFDIQVSINRKSETESFKVMTEIANDVQKKLKTEGFKESEVKLTNYSTQATYDYPNGQQRKTGYVSTQGLNLKFPVNKERILKVYSLLASDKVEGVNINFYTECSDSLKSKVQKELITKAVNDARAKAELLASASGCSIKSVKEINYKVEMNPVVPYRPVAYQMMKAEAGSIQDSASSFSINEQEFTEEVRITYLIQGSK